MGRLKSLHIMKLLTQTPETSIQKDFDVVKENLPLLIWIDTVDKCQFQPLILDNLLESKVHNWKSLKSGYLITLICNGHQHSIPLSKSVSHSQISKDTSFIHWASNFMWTTQKRENRGPLHYHFRHSQRYIRKM